MMMAVEEDPRLLSAFKNATRVWWVVVIKCMQSDPVKKHNAPRSLSQLAFSPFAELTSRVALYQSHFMSTKSS